MLFVQGADDAVVAGHHLLATANKMNLGIVVVVDSLNVVVRGNAVSQMSAPSTAAARNDSTRCAWSLMVIAKSDTIVS